MAFGEFVSSVQLPANWQPPNGKFQSAECVANAASDLRNICDHRFPCYSRFVLILLANAPFLRYGLEVPARRDVI